MRRDAAGARQAALIEPAGAPASWSRKLARARTGRRSRPQRRPAELRSERGLLAPWEPEAGHVGFDWLGGPTVSVLDQGGLARVLGNLMANAAEHGAGGSG